MYVQKQREDVHLTLEGSTGDPSSFSMYRIAKLGSPLEGLPRALMKLIT